MRSVGFIWLWLALALTGLAEPPSTHKVWSDEATNLLGGPSPDGQWISYVDPASGDLAVYEVASGRKRRLTRNAPEAETFAYFSAFSRDSSRLAYAWFNEEGFYEIWTVDAAGGEPRRVYSNPETGFVQPCDWSLDGKKILTLFFRRDNVSQIALVDAEDGSVQVLKTLSWFYPKKISFSPDGRHILYDSILGRGGVARDILLLSADGSAERKLIEHDANDIFPMWSPTGDAVVFASDRSGDMDLWRVAVRDGAAAGQPQRIARSFGRALPMGVTRDGVYYYGLRAGRSDVVTAKVSDGRAVEPQTAGIRSAGRIAAPAWSRDGKRLASLTQLGTENYGRDSRGVAIWVPATRQETMLIPSLATISQLRWSPDDRRLLASGSDGRGRSGLYAVDPDSGAVSDLVRRYGGEPSGLEGDWLDAETLAYVNQERTKIQRYRIADRKEETLWGAPEGATIHHLRASADGAWLAFGLGPEDRVQQIRVLRVADGEVRSPMQVDGDGSAAAIEWSGEQLFVTIRAKSLTVWKADLDGSKPVKTALPANPRFSAAGGQIAYVRSDQRSEVWALEGWLPPGEQLRSHSESIP